MDIFIPFPLESDRKLQERLFAQIGGFQDETGALKDYVSVFNHDVNAINNLLNNPPSVYRYYEKALTLQEEYNQALIKAQTRWKSSEKSYEIGTSVVTDLSERKKRFESAYQTYQQMESRKQRLQNIIGDKPKDQSFAQFWQRLTEQAERLDKIDTEQLIDSVKSAALALDKIDSGKRVDIIERLVKDEQHLTEKQLMAKAQQVDHSKKASEKQAVDVVTDVLSVIGQRKKRLQALKADWMGQDIFALASAADLLKFKKELMNFRSFLDFIEQHISFDAKSDVDQKIKNILSINRRKLKRLENALAHAMGWRIHAASLAGNLRFDDNYYALIKEIRDLVFLYDSKEDLSGVSDLLVVNKAALSYDFDFETCEKTLKHIKQSEHLAALKKWRGTKWACDKEKSFYIHTVFKNDTLIPANIATLIPDSPGYSIAGFIHYWYFQAKKIAIEFLQWLREKLVGMHGDAVLFINETISQVKAFKTLLSTPENKKKSINLYYLTQSPAFLDALEVSTFIEREQKRGESVKPSWTMGVLFGWVPFFNRKSTYTLFEKYTKTISDADQELKKDCSSIAQHIVKDFEQSLFESIKQRVFILPKTLMTDIQKFIMLYGTPELLSQYKQITDPVQLLKRFDFLHPQDEKSDLRKLNEDNLYSFLNFARTYWTNEQYQASLLLMKIITREQLPVTDAQLDRLFIQTRSLYLVADDSSAKQAFMQLLAYLAKQYVFQTGDQGDGDSYLFLKKFHPDAAKHWLDERNENLDDKFIFVRSLLDIKRNKEIDIKAETVYDAGQIQLEYRHVAKYIQDLGNAQNQKPYIEILYPMMHKYVNFYYGQNNHYAQMILSYGKFKSDILLDYMKKRLFWLIKNAPINPLTDDDATFFSGAAKRESYRDALNGWLASEYDGSHDALDMLIESIAHPTTDAVYYAKKLQYLIKHKHYKEVLDNKELFEIIKKNPFFEHEMNTYFDRALDEAIKNRNYKEVETLGFLHMVERFGTQTNKEAYRILRIKRLLSLQELSETQAFVESMLTYVADLDNQFVTLPKGKMLLGQIYRDEIEDCKTHQKWHGHLQYALEFFGANQSVTMQQEAHLLWLKQFLSNPTRISEKNEAQTSSLDLKLHYQNLKIPNSDIDLKKFYGTNINAVFECMMQRMDSYSEDVTDTGVRLIERYAKDPSFKVHPQYMLLSKKIEDFKRAQQILNAMRMDDPFVLMQLFDHFIDDHQGQIVLLNYDDQGIKQRVIQYQEMLLNNLFVSYIDKMKQLILSFDDICLQSYNPVFNEAIAYFAQVKRSKLPGSVKNQIESIAMHREEVWNTYKNIFDNLNIEKLHLFQMNEKQVILLDENCSNQLKSELTKRIDMILSLLPINDPLAQSLQALSTYINHKSLSLDDKSELLDRIAQFSKHQRQYPNLAEDMADKLIEKLIANDSIGDIALFKDENSSLQYTFVKYISSKTKTKLCEALSARIQQLAHNTNHEKLMSRSDFVKYGQLFEWLKQSPDINTKKLEREASQQIAKSLEHTKTSSDILTSALDALVDGHNMSADNSFLDSGIFCALTKEQSLSVNIIEREHQFIESAVMVRLFGNGSQRDELDKIINEVARRLRKAFMSGMVNPYLEHGIKFASQLITYSGNDEQRAECNVLMDMWNRYLVDVKDLTGLRSETIKKALPAYTEEINAQIYRYFIDKFNLPDAFITQIRAWQESVDLSKDIIDAKSLQKKYSLQQFLQTLQKNAQNKGFLNLNKPRPKDATKLFIAFCLNLQAQQLVSLWLKKIERNETSGVDVDNIAEILEQRYRDLCAAFKIKSHRFNTHMLSTINSEKDYFTSAIVQHEFEHRDDEKHEDSKGSNLESPHSPKRRASMV